MTTTTKVREAKQLAEDKIIEANMLLWEAIDILQGHASPAFEHEVSKVQHELRDFVGLVRNIQ